MEGGHDRGWTIGGIWRDGDGLRTVATNRHLAVSDILIDGRRSAVDWHDAVLSLILAAMVVAGMAAVAVSSGTGSDYCPVERNRLSARCDHLEGSDA